ncbi:MAG: hypothetical protein KKG09_05390 [Verrucomicrobia bacterium]|nr:hypothetical protein [Verrucomicrobiota bacterium]MCG2681756.1 hypothetical protein [Kiritimatiellia bacterium]MBU4247170.1 hypothetical protein [Verrucomicrobiota bacterium]MBU4291074.1 hypothetical protein [Verrucomicrobiota bacterium]MBU4429707.1 hypothetical protein [Verrucomicrobiota bacterium]
MKLLRYCFPVLAGMMFFAAGCCHTPKVEDKIVISSGEYEEITVTVAEDQTIEYQGKRMPIAEVPNVLTVKDPSKHIFLYVYAQSKVTEETIKEFLKNLKINGFSVEFMPGSKYSHLPIPTG